MNTFTVESFATGTRNTVIAPTVWDALEGQPEPCFALVQSSDGYAAISPANDAFIVPGQHVASTPEEAAASIREHYAAIQEAL